MTNMIRRLTRPTIRRIENSPGQRDIPYHERSLQRAYQRCRPRITALFTTIGFIARKQESAKSLDMRSAPGPFGMLC
jgi:hypothetical protein